MLGATREQKRQRANLCGIGKIAPCTLKSWHLLTFKLLSPPLYLLCHTPEGSGAAWAIPGTDRPAALV